MAVRYDKRLKKNIVVFGEFNQWAISHDGGSLLFHPQYESAPEKTSKYIWKEAFEHVLHLGGFNRLIHSLNTYKENPH